MIFGNGEKKIRIFRVEFEFVDALAVADVVLDAVHRGRTEDPDNAAKSGGSKKRFSRFRIVRPTTETF